VLLQRPLWIVCNGMRLDWGTGLLQMNAKLSITCKKILAACRDALFPASCNCCERLFRVTKRPGIRMGKDIGLGSALYKVEMAPFLCPRCKDQFHPIGTPMCICCGLPFASLYGPDHLCGSCASNPNCYDKARSVGYYATSLRSAIHRYKYGAGTHLAAPLGRLLWHALHAYFQPADIDMIIPVPLHHRRLRSRGFNQSALLVRRWPALGQAEGYDMEHPKITQGLLTRHRPTLPQTGLNKAQRSDNLRRAFSVSNKVILKGKRVLLVDDVLTTGATANACAFVLKQAGAATVDVLTLARTV